MSEQSNRNKRILGIAVIIFTVAVVGAVYIANTYFINGTESSSRQEPGNAHLEVSPAISPAPPQMPKKADSNGVFHVRPGMSIQDALESAAVHPEHKIVKVHAGTYRPKQHGQAMIWLNSRHDGITLVAEEFALGWTPGERYRAQHVSHAAVSGLRSGCMLTERWNPLSMGSDPLTLSGP